MTSAQYNVFEVYEDVSSKVFLQPDGDFAVGAKIDENGEKVVIHREIEHPPDTIIRMETPTEPEEDYPSITRTAMIIVTFTSAIVLLTAVTSHLL
jgi:hypothetical protein